MLTDGRTDRVIGILIAHLRAFGSGELKIKKNLSKVLKTFEKAPFSIIFLNTLYFKGVKRHYHGVKG